MAGRMGRRRQRVRLLEVQRAIDRGRTTNSSLGAMALTREEKRQKKLLADLNKGGSSSSPRKSTSGGAYSKHGKVLKGGAIDATVATPLQLCCDCSHGAPFGEGAHRSHSQLPTETEHRQAGHPDDRRDCARPSEGA